jgi:hypothetical protein
MTEEQIAKLVKRLDELNFTQGDISVITAVIRSVLRESKEQERAQMLEHAQTWNDYQRAIRASSEKGGAR